MEPGGRTLLLTPQVALSSQLSGAHDTESARMRLSTDTLLHRQIPLTASCFGLTETHSYIYVGGTKLAERLECRREVQDDPRIL